MPKSPIWECAVGMLGAQEFYTNARSTHYEIRVGAGPVLTIFPHELADLRALVDKIEADRNRPHLVLDERRRA